jgi:hypothetical protein
MLLSVYTSCPIPTRNSVIASFTPKTKETNARSLKTRQEIRSKPRKYPSLNLATVTPMASEFGAGGSRNRVTLRCCKVSTQDVELVVVVSLVSTGHLRGRWRQSVSCWGSLAQLREGMEKTLLEQWRS